jgi:cysteine synthase A
VHSLLTAREIERSCGADLDVLVAGVSTGGQLSGLARYLKPRYPRLRLIGVDVEGSVIMGTPAKPYKMTGMGLSFRPPNLDYQHLSQGYAVPERLAFSVCHALARTEGLLLGASTGAIVAAGLSAAATMPDGARLVMINPDRGDRYLDTVYDPQWLADNAIQLYAGEQLRAAIQALRPVPRLPV